MNTDPVKAELHLTYFVEAKALYNRYVAAVKEAETRVKLEFTEALNRLNVQSVEAIRMSFEYRKDLDAKKTMLRNEYTAALEELEKAIFGEQRIRRESEI